MKGKKVKKHQVAKEDKKIKNTQLKASATQWKKFKEVCKEHECESQAIDKEKIKEVVKSVVKS